MPLTPSARVLCVLGLLAASAGVGLATGGAAAHAPAAPRIACFALDAYSEGPGGVESAPGPDCAGNYTLGTPITFTATPDGGNTFLGWSDDAGGTCNPLVLPMNGYRLVVGHFTSVAGFVDERGPGVSYDAWTFRTQSSPCEGYLAFAGTKKGSLRIAATPGDSVDLVLAHGPDQGRADVKVDGKTKAKLDLYDADPREAFTVTVSGLDPLVAHVVELVATGKRNPLSSGTEVRFYSLDAGPGHVEETGDAVTIDGVVHADDGPGSHGGSVRVLASTKAAMHFSYGGAGATLYYGCGPDTGVLRIVVDGDRANATLVDTYQASDAVCTVPAGPAGNHVVAVSPTGKRNKLSTGKTVAVDGYSVP